VIATVTVPVKPFSAVANTLTGEPVAPATMASDAGDRVSEKSAADTGTVTWAPHDARARHKIRQHPCAIFATSGMSGHCDEIAIAFAAEGRVGSRESDFQF
jgi:hypothetical protein